VVSPPLVHPHHWRGLGRDRRYESSSAVGEFRLVLGFVEVLNEQFHNRRFILWKIDFGVRCFLSNVLAGCNSAISNGATYLTRETLSTSKELRASADNGFVHVVRIAITGDNKVRVIARDEQAAAE
jgi:hypothetical protein